MSCISRFLFWRDSIAPEFAGAGVSVKEGFIVGSCFLGSRVTGRSIVPAPGVFMPRPGSYADGHADACAVRRRPGRRARHPRHPTAVLGPGEACLTDGTGLAQRLGVLDVGRGLGEEDLGVVGTARDSGAETVDLVVELGEGQQGVLLRSGRRDQVGHYGRGVRLELHCGVFLVCSARLVAGRLGKTKGPRIPVWVPRPWKVPT